MEEKGTKNTRAPRKALCASLNSHCEGGGGVFAFCLARVAGAGGRLHEKVWSRQWVASWVKRWQICILCHKPS